MFLRKVRLWQFYQLIDTIRYIIYRDDKNQYIDKNNLSTSEYDVADQVKRMIDLIRKACLAVILRGTYK